MVFQKGQTMLDRAIQYEQTAIVQLLMLAGATASPKNKTSKMQELVLFWESVLAAPRKSSDLCGRSMYPSFHYCICFILLSCPLILERTHLPVRFFHSNLKNMDEIHLGNNRLPLFNAPIKLKATLVDLSKNNLTYFPGIGYMNYLVCCQL